MFFLYWYVVNVHVLEVLTLQKCTWLLDFNRTQHMEDHSLTDC